MNPSVNPLSDLPPSSGDLQPEPSESSTPSTPMDEATTSNAETTTSAATRQQPIPPPSEPMQYRAIGLVQGKYTSSEDQFTRGTLLASDGTAVDAVLLGRVMSLVRNHLNLEQEHLWVVYPRTRQEDDNLHFQIVGVWEPERLNQPSTSAEDSPESDETGETGSTETDISDGYFSVRGEVIYQSKENQGLVIKIKQSPRKEEDKPKFFKLKLNGVLAEKAVGHFWDLQIQRQGNALVVQESIDIGLMSPKKGMGRKPYRGGGGRPSGRRGDSPSRSYGDRERPVRKDGKPIATTPPVRREPLPKPVKRQTPGNEGGASGKTSS